MRLRFEALQRLGRGTLSGALGLLYPPECALCERPLDFDEDDPLQGPPRFLCERCWEELRRERIELPYCARCGEPLPGPAVDLCGGCAHTTAPFEKARSYGLYEGCLARLVKLLKYHREPALAGELASLLAEVVAQERMEFEAITFVPLSRRRLRERGFNQAERLARALGKLCGAPVFPALRKARETLPQEALSRRERLLNLQGSFAPLGRARCPRILLIDDVYTTGATVRECSSVLKEAGYERVFVLTVARTPHPRPSSAEEGHPEEVEG